MTLHGELSAIVCSEPFNPPEQRSSDRDRVTVSVSRLIIEGEQGLDIRDLWLWNNSTGIAGSSKHHSIGGLCLSFYYDQQIP